MRPWLLSEVNYGYVREHPYEVAVLPLGATEPHNLHLPYGTDTLQIEEIGRRACEAAHQRGAKIVLLPAIPYGTETNMMRFPMAMNLNPSTVGRVVRDLVGSLERHGVRKCLLLNGHGGNDLKPLLRELHLGTAVHLFLCDWYRMAADVSPSIFDKAGEHADEAETSLGLAYFPELVARDADTGRLAADEGAVRESRFEAVNRGWVTLTRPWHLLTTHTGVGDPFAASANKGRLLMAVIVERLSQFLVELGAAVVDERFPY